MTIRGVIRNSVTEAPLTDVHIRISVGENEIAAFFSDENGEFEITRAGDYTGQTATIRAQKTQFKPLEVTHKIQGDVVELELELVPPKPVPLWAIIAGASAAVVVLAVVLFFVLRRPAVPPSIATRSTETGVAVTLESETRGAGIRYSLDGSVPSRTDGRRYEGPFTVGERSVLNAVAFSFFTTDSDVASRRIEPPPERDATVVDFRKGWPAGEVPLDLLRRNGINTIRAVTPQTGCSDAVAVVLRPGTHGLDTGFLSSGQLKDPTTCNHLPLVVALRELSREARVEFVGTPGATYTLLALDRRAILVDSRSAPVPATRRLVELELDVASTSSNIAYLVFGAGDLEWIKERTVLSNRLLRELLPLERTLDEPLRAREPIRSLQELADVRFASLTMIQTIVHVR